MASVSKGNTSARVSQAQNLDHVQKSKGLVLLNLKKTSIGSAHHRVPFRKETSGFFRRAMVCLLDAEGEELHMRSIW